MNMYVSHKADTQAIHNVHLDPLYINDPLSFGVREARGGGRRGFRIPRPLSKLVLPVLTMFF